MPRYKVTKDGKTLIDITTKQQIPIKSFAIEHRQAGGNHVVFNKGESTEVSMRRWNIDESEFHLSSDKEKAQPKKRMTSISTTQLQERTALFTRDELIQVHQALQMAADITLKKLVGLIRAE